MTSLETLSALCIDRNFLKIFIKFSSLSHHLVESRGLYPFKNNNTSYFLDIIKNLRNFRSEIVNQLKIFIEKLDYNDCVSLGLIQTQCYNCSLGHYCESLHWALSYSSV